MNDSAPTSGIDVEYDENVVTVNIDYDEPIHHQAGNKEREDTFIHPEKQKNVSEAPMTKVPEVGLEFETEEEAYQFYNNYAAAMGFSIRRSSKLGDPVIYRKFCCSAQGRRQPDKRYVFYKTSRPETRTNCGAYMVVNSRFTGKFKVVEFVPDHNHELVSPRKAHLLRSHRKIKADQALEIDNFSASGIAPKAGLTYASKKVGGREKVGYILEDVKNYLRSKRTIQMQDGDTAGLLNYMQSKQSKDPNFYNAMQVDEDALITNIFWADGQMMSDYEYFGDVVCFDTTYRKNKEDRPFGLFVGVNHHKQTVVFGAAFLYDETAESFKWLFGTFEEAMKGKKPVTIFTDEDIAMAKALKEVWHGTYHRLCILHIYQNAAKHLSDVFNKFSNFVHDFRNCIYGYEAEEDFLDAWDDMLGKYEGLRNNDWLKRLFSKKEQWALVYGRQHFCADILSTQRSESMNSVLKMYVSHKSNLLQFFEQFDRLIEDRRYEELKADLRSNHSKIKLFNEFEILKHAREVYTHKTFKLFQAELSMSYDAKKRKIDESGTTYRYEITPLNKTYHRTVTYHAFDNMIFCSCQKFEFAGILCSHALKVLGEHNVMRIPDLYIKKRWTKSAKRGIIDAFPRAAGTSNSGIEMDEKSRYGDRYRELCRIFSQLTTRAALADDTFEVAKVTGYKALEDVDAMFDSKKITEPTTTTTSYVVKNALVSRVTKKHGDASLELENQVVEDGGNVDKSVVPGQESSSGAEAIIRGVKKKQTPKVKSGKRLKSGLEEAIKKRKPRNNKNSSSDKEEAVKSVVNSGLTETAALQTSFRPPVLPFSQASQSNQGVRPYWSSPHIPWGATYFRNEHGVSYLSPSQLMNPNIPQQLMNPNYPQSENMDQNNSTSMTKLLQGQMLHEHARDENGSA